MDIKNYFDTALNNNKGAAWIQRRGLFVKGYAFMHGELFEGEALGLLLQTAILEERIDETLRSLNGFFSAVIDAGTSVYLIVDKVRAYPLLICKAQRCKWIISDSGKSIELDGNIEKKVDSLNSMEFLALGYNSGHGTIYTDITTVDAGEYVRLGADGDVRRVSYFKYIFTKEAFSRVETIEKAFQSLESAFQRTIETIPLGYQIVIPLSGGYDSRLIACLCKKYNLNNVVCFTYGRKDSYEVQTSEKVAKTLGFEWYYVEYSAQKLATMIESEEFKDFSTFASNYNSIPPIQEFLAIKELKNQRLIQENAIVIPGYCGDLFGGSKIPREVFRWKKSQFTPQNFAGTIYHHFYDLNIPVRSVRSYIVNKIQSEIEQYDISNLNGFIDYYEQWCISNRLGKYIINSVRTYEYFGLGWRMPFWDDEYAATWYRVPWENKSADLLCEFMFIKYFSVFGVTMLKPKGIDSSKVLIIRRILPSFIYSFGRYIWNWINKRNPQKDVNCFSGAAEILSSEIAGRLKMRTIKSYRKKFILAVLAVREYIRYNKK